MNTLGFWLLLCCQHAHACGCQYANVLPVLTSKRVACVNMQICAVANMQCVQSSTCDSAICLQVQCFCITSSKEPGTSAASRHTHMSEPPEEYIGSFVSFVVLDKAGDSKPASTKRITDWVKHKSADFCRLTSTEVPICLCRICCHLCDHKRGTSLHVQPVVM